MDEALAELIHDGDHLTPEDWDGGFWAQTGQNINVAANGIAKLLGMMIELDDRHLFSRISSEAFLTAAQTGCRAANSQ